MYSSSEDNGVTERVQGFISGKNATEKLVYVAQLAARRSPVVLARAKCGEQKDGASSAHLRRKYVCVAFHWLAWEEGKFLSLTEAGIPENFS